MVTGPILGVGHSCGPALEALRDQCHYPGHYLDCSRSWAQLLREAIAPPISEHRTGPRAAGHRFPGRDVQVLLCTEVCVPSSTHQAWWSGLHQGTGPSLAHTKPRGQQLNGEGGGWMGTAPPR